MKKERQTEINDRITFGCWDKDAVIGKREGKAALLTVGERLTRKLHMVKVPPEDSSHRFQEKHQTLRRKIRRSFQVRHKRQRQRICVFTRLLTWKNEEQNSIIRRFFPKGTLFDDITDEQIAFVENWINSLPREILDYHYSDFIFESVLIDVAIFNFKFFH